MAEIEVFPDAASLAWAAAGRVVALAGAAIAERGQFSLALSGGSTPRALYALLASETFAPRLDWPRVNVFWGDERCVPPEHPDSNYRLARESLLDKIMLLPDNIHCIQGELPPDQAAAAYRSELETVAVRDNQV